LHANVLFFLHLFCRTKVKRGKVAQEPEPEPEAPSSEGGSILSSLKESSYRVRWLVDAYENSVYPEQHADEFEGDDQMVDFDECQLQLRAETLHDVSDTLDRLKITDVAVMMSEDGDKRQEKEVGESIKSMKDSLFFSKNLTHTKANMIADKISQLQSEHNTKMKTEKDEMRKRSKIDDIIERNRLHELENAALKKTLDEKKSYIDMKSRQKGKKSLDELREEFEAIAEKERERLETLLLRKQSSCEAVANGQVKRALKLKELQSQLAHTISNVGKNGSVNNAKSATHYSNAPVAAKVPTAPSSLPSSKAITAPSRPRSSSSRPRTGDRVDTPDAQSEGLDVDTADATVITPASPAEDSAFVLGKNSLGDRIAKREREVAELRSTMENARLRRTEVEAEGARCQDIVAEVRQTITKAALSERVQKITKGQQEVADLRLRLQENQVTIAEIERELAEPMPNFLEEERLRLEQEKAEEKLRLAEEAERRRLGEEEAARLAEEARLEEERRLAEETELLQALQAATAEAQALSVSFEESETVLRRRRNEPVYVESIVRSVRPQHLFDVANRMLRLVLTARSQLSAEEQAAQEEEEEEPVQLELPRLKSFASSSDHAVGSTNNMNVLRNSDPVVVADRHAAENHPHVPEDHHTHYIRHAPDHHQDAHHIHAHPLGGHQEKHPGVDIAAQQLSVLSAMHPPVRAVGHPTVSHAPQDQSLTSVVGSAGAEVSPVASQTVAPSAVTVDSTACDSIPSSAGGSTVAVAPAPAVAASLASVEAGAAAVVAATPATVVYLPVSAPTDAPVPTGAPSLTPAGTAGEAPVSHAGASVGSIPAPGSSSAQLTVGVTVSVPAVAPTTARKAVKALKKLVSTRMFLQFKAKPVTPEATAASTAPGTAGASSVGAGASESRAGTAASEDEYCDPSQDFGLVLAKEHLENLLAVLRPTKVMTQHTRILENLRESCSRTEESLVGVLHDNGLLRKAVHDTEKDSRRVAAQLHIQRKRFLKTLDGLCGLPINISLTEEELHVLRDKVAELTKTELSLEQKIRAKRESLYVEATAPHSKQDEVAVAMPRVDSDHSALTQESSASQRGERKNRKKKTKPQATDGSNDTLLDEYKSRTMLRKVIPTPAGVPEAGPATPAGPSAAVEIDELDRASGLMRGSGSSATLHSSVSDITGGSGPFNHFRNGDFVPPGNRTDWGVSADPGALREDDILRQYYVGAVVDSPKELSDADAQAVALANAYGGGNTVQLDCRSPEEIVRSAEMGILRKLDYYYELKQQQKKDFQARVKAQQVRLQPRDNEFYQRVPKIVNTPTVQFSINAEPVRFFPYNANTWFAKEAVRTRSPAVQTLDTKEQVFGGRGGYGPDGLYHEFDNSKPGSSNPAGTLTDMEAEIDAHVGPHHPQPWRIGRVKPGPSRLPRTKSGQGPQTSAAHFVNTAADVEGLGLAPRPPSGSITPIVGTDVGGARAGRLTPGRRHRETADGDISVDIDFDASVGNGNYPPFNDEHVEFPNSAVSVHGYLAPKGNIARPPSERRRLANNMKYVQGAIGSFPPLSDKQTICLHMPVLTAELLEEVEAAGPGVAESSMADDEQTHMAPNYCSDVPTVNSSERDTGSTAPTTGARSANPYDHIAKNVEESGKKFVQFPTTVASALQSPGHDLAHLAADGSVLDPARPREWERTEGIAAMAATQIINSYNPAHSSQGARVSFAGVDGETMQTPQMGRVISDSTLQEQASTASDHLAERQMQMQAIVDEHMENLGPVDEGDDEDHVLVPGGAEEEQEVNLCKTPFKSRYKSVRDPVIEHKLEAFEPPEQYDSVSQTDTLQQHYSPVGPRESRFVQKNAWGVKKPLLSVLRTRTNYSVSRGFSRATTGYSNGREMTEAEMNDELEALRGIFNEYSQDESVYGPDERGVSDDVSDVLYGMRLTGTTRHGTHQRGRGVLVKKNPYAEDTHLSAYCYDAGVIREAQTQQERAIGHVAAVDSFASVGSLDSSGGGSRVVSGGVSAPNSVVGPLATLALDGKALDTYNSKSGTAAGTGDGVGGGFDDPAAESVAKDREREREERRALRSEPTGQVPPGEIVGLQVVAAGVVGERSGVYGGPMGDSDEEDDIADTGIATGISTTSKTVSVTLPSIVPTTMESCLDDVNFEEFI